VERGPGGAPLAQTVENVAWPDVGPQVPFDFTNPQVVAEMLQRIRSFSGYEDYSALSVDAVRIANNNGSCGVFANGVWQQKFGGNTGYDPSCQNPSYPGYCDPAWTQAAERWLERLRDEMHKDGKRLHVNMSYAGESSPYYPLALDATLERIFDIVDAVMDERGFNRNRCGGYSYDGEHACTGSTVDFDDWSSERAYIAALEQRSKPYYVKTAFGPFPTPANIEWALANYLVANKGRTSIYVSPLEDNDGLWSFSQLEFYLGLPCGLAIEDGDKVTRKYESGLVVVHKGAPMSPSVTETPSPNRDYYAFDPVSGLYDAPVSGSVVLLAQSARVLFIDGAPTCN
jgi:hypothetical protein